MGSDHFTARGRRGAFVVLALSAGLLLAAPAGAQEPPDVAGSWEVAFGSALNGRRWTLLLEGAGQRLSGTVEMGSTGPARIQRVIQSGNRLLLEFAVEVHGRGSTVVFEGRVNERRYRGSMTGFPGTDAAVSFTASRQASRTLPPDPTPPYREVELRAENGWFIVSVVGNGTDSLEFIVDTGAGISAVTEDTAARLGLGPGNEVTAQGASGTQRLRLSSLPSLAMGDLVSENLRVLVLPAGTLAPFADGEEGRGPYDGVVGADILTRFDVLIDPLAGQLRLYDHGERPGAELLSQLGDVVPFRRIGGDHVLHDVDVNGVTVPAVLDTGSRYLLLNSAAAEAAGVERTSIEVSSPGVGTDEVEIGKGRLDVFMLASAAARDVPVSIGDLPVFSAVGFAGRPVVLLGNPAVRRCPIFLSYSDNTVRYCREIR